MVNVAMLWTKGAVSAGIIRQDKQITTFEGVNSSPYLPKLSDGRTSCRLFCVYLGMGGGRAYI